MKSLPLSFSYACLLLMVAVPIRTMKGREKRSHNGHLYVFDRYSSGEAVKFWRCELKSDKCQGRLDTNADRCGSQGSWPTLAREQCSKSQGGTSGDSNEEKSRRDCRGTAQVVNETVQNISHAAQGQMLTPFALKKMVQRKRNEVAHAPPLPVTSSWQLSRI